MLIGNPQCFAIEGLIHPQTPQDFVLGQIRFFALHEPIGDWDDTVALGSCISWLRDFIGNPQNRYEICFNQKSKEEIFDILCKSMFANNTDLSLLLDTYTRFSIQHLGMSSFENFDIFLLETFASQRIIWRSIANLEVKEACLPPGEMQCIANQFCDWFDASIPS